MDRREFLMASGGGIGLVCIPPLAGCSSTGAGDSFDPGPYRVGDDLLVLDEDGAPMTIDVHGHVLTEAGGDVAARSTGSGPGDATAQWNHPLDAHVDGAGRMYVLDHGNSRVHVYEADGAYVGTISGHGSGPNDLAHPQDLHVHEGRIYVCDTLNHRVQVFDADGQPVMTCAGGEGDEHALNGPRGIAIDSSGELHVLDSGNARVQVFDAQGQPVRSYGGFGTEPGKMQSPRTIAAATGGRMVIADPVAGWVHVFTETGAFVGRFRPMDDEGLLAVPLGAMELPDGTLYVFAGGLRAFQSAAS